MAFGEARESRALRVATPSQGDTSLLQAYEVEIWGKERNVLGTMPEPYA